MKSNIVFLLTSVLGLTIETARADDANNCFWVEYISGASRPVGSERQEFNVDVPSTVKLQVVPVGKVMATSAVQQVTGGKKSVKCPIDKVKIVAVDHAMGPGSTAQLESGYSDVYKTGVAGIGVRFIERGRVFVPLNFRFENFPAVVHPMPSGLQYEFVRTAQNVGSGDLKLNFEISVMINNWYAANINVNGSTSVETGSYFSGCAGVKKNINVPMGKVWAGELRVNVVRNRAFDLDVRCMGQPAGTKLPVKVYFEGDSPADGRLNLQGGGASGVEIALVNEKGTALPFTSSRAMSMSWMRTDAEGEIYNLPIRASYVKKANAQVVAGKADATLNYILEYN